MLLFLDEEDLKDADFMEALNDELNNAEKLCKKYGYDGEFWIDDTDYSVNGDIYSRRDEYQPKIYIRDRKNFKIEIQTTSYGALSIDEYNKFLSDNIDAMHLAEDLTNTLFICSQLVK